MEDKQYCAWSHDNGTRNNIVHGTLRKQEQWVVNNSKQIVTEWNVWKTETTGEKH